MKLSDKIKKYTGNHINEIKENYSNEAKEILMRLNRAGIKKEDVGFNPMNFIPEEKMKEIKNKLKESGYNPTDFILQRIKYKIYTIEKAIKEIERLQNIAELQKKEKEKDLYFEKLDNFMKDIPPDLKNNEFIETVEYKKFETAVLINNKNIFIPGAIGVGKTRYAIEIAKKYILSGGDAIYVPLNGVIYWPTEIMNNFIDNLKKLRSKPFLIILDDIIEDIYRKYETDWLKQKAQLLLKEIFSHNTLIIITSNNSIRDIEIIWDDGLKDGKISHRIKRTCMTKWKVTCPKCGYEHEIFQIYENIKLQCKLCKTTMTKKNAELIPIEGTNVL